jgi:hypothetical protein
MKKKYLKLCAFYKCALNKRALYDIRVDVVTSEQCVVRECSDTKERTRQKPHTLNCISIVLRLDVGPGEVHRQQDRTANLKTVVSVNECILEWTAKMPGLCYVGKEGS